MHKPNIISGSRITTAMEVTLDFSEAARWLDLAAGQGLVRAQCSLALMYVRGEGVKRDLLKAKNLTQRGINDKRDGELCAAVWARYGLGNVK